jgi:H+/Cl- antiporter ClcA
VTRPPTRRNSHGSTAAEVHAMNRMVLTWQHSGREAVAMADDTADAAQSRKIGIRTGLGIIAFGLVTAILLYVIESLSSNFIREEHAIEFAIMYVLFCAVVGLMVFRWFNRQAPDHTTVPEPGATAPTKEQTWTRRRATLGGLVAIALGLGSAMVMYLVDSSWWNFSKMMHAMDMAIVHAVLWSIVGGILILYHNGPTQRARHRVGEAVMGALSGWLVSTRGKPKGTTSVVKRDQ